jgi:hypothetical protein
MTVYWILFLILIFIQVITPSTEKASNNSLIFSFFLMFVYSAIRANGFDYDSYENAYNDFNRFYGSSSFYPTMELGYIWLNIIMPSYRFLLVFLSAFTCITYYWLFHKYIPIKHYWLGFLLMSISGNNMLIFQMSGLRNAIAINIMALSMPFIIERKIFPYVALTILAFYFHNSVIFFMPIAYFVATPFKINIREIVIWSLVFGFLVFVSSTSLIDYVSSFIDIYFDKYSVYTEQAKEKVYERSLLMYTFVFSILTISLIILRKVNLSEKDNVIIKLSMLFLISLVLGSLNVRMSQYFAPYLVVSAIIVLNRVKQPILKYVYLGTICLFLWYSFFIVYMGGADVALYEYKTIFD